MLAEGPAFGAERLRKGVLRLFFASLCLSVAIQQTALALLLSLMAWVSVIERRPPATPLNRPLGLFLGALLLSTLLSPDVWASLGAYRKLWLVGAFFATYRLVEGPREAWRLVLLAVGVAAVVSAYGVVQHFTGIDWARELLGKEPRLDPFWFGADEGFRTKGLHPSGITYAHNLLFPLAFASALMLEPALGARARLGLLAAWIPMVFALLFSLTRGVWVAYLAVLVLLAILKGLRATLSMAACALVLGAFLMSAGPGVQERGMSIFSLSDNLGRGQIWRANVAMIRERPLRGWGFGNFKRFRDPYYQSYPGADTMAHAHNNFLQVWVDGGLGALAAFLYLFAVILKKGVLAYRRSIDPRSRALALGGVLAVFGFLVGGLTQYNFGDAEVVVVLWAVAGVLLRVSESPPTQDTDSTLAGPAAPPVC